MIIKRLSNTEHGMFGVALWNHIPFAVTLERQWRNNKTSESCIPLGVYLCIRCNKSPDYHGDSPRFGDTFQVFNVPGRSKILFHKGNLDDDTHGCILIGEQFGLLSGTPGILSSLQGFSEFKRLSAGLDEFMLSIE